MPSIDTSYSVTAFTQVTTVKSAPRKRIIFTVVSGAPIALTQNATPTILVTQGIVLTAVGSALVDEVDITKPSIYQGDWFAVAAAGVLAVHEEY